MVSSDGSWVVGFCGDPLHVVLPQDVVPCFPSLYLRVIAVEMVMGFHIIDEVFQILGGLEFPPESIDLLEP